MAPDARTPEAALSRAVLANQTSIAQKVFSCVPIYEPGQKGSAYE